MDLPPLSKPVSVEPAKRKRTSTGLKKKQVELQSNPTTSSNILKLSPEDMNKCSQMLQILKMHAYAEPFSLPINLGGLGLPSEIISLMEPMDLSTVEKKLRNNEYLSPTQFGTDIRRIWKTFKGSNVEGSNIHIMALEMEQFSEKLLREMEEMLMPPTTTHDLLNAESKGKNSYKQTNGINNKSDKTELPGLETKLQSQPQPQVQPQINQNMKPQPQLQSQTQLQQLQLQHQSQSQMQSQAMLHQQQLHLQSQAHFQAQQQLKPQPAKITLLKEIPMTTNEKKVLCQNIQSLPPLYLKGLWDIVNESLPPNQRNKEIIEFDLDLLSVEATRRIERYINFHMNLTNKKISNNTVNNRDSLMTQSHGKRERDSSVSQDKVPFQFF